jgi:hypothetical protein
VTQPPDFDDLVGREGTTEELARLRRVHDLLVSVGPPPELSPMLEEAPETTQKVTWLPRRRRGAILVLAAAIAGAAFGAGYALGPGGGFDVAWSAPMHGSGSTRLAGAVIKAGEADEKGNLPIELTVHGLPKLGKRESYLFYLSKKGKPVALCGTFTAGRERTTVQMSVPYELKQFDGWVVVKHSWGNPVGSGPVVLTT